MFFVPFSEAFVLSIVFIFEERSVLLLNELSLRFFRFVIARVFLPPSMRSISTSVFRPKTLGLVIGLFILSLIKSGSLYSKPFLLELLRLRSAFWLSIEIPFFIAAKLLSRCKEVKLEIFSCVFRAPCELRAVSARIVLKLLFSFLIEDGFVDTSMLFRARLGSLSRF